MFKSYPTKLHSLESVEARSSSELEKLSFPTSSSGKSEQNFLRPSCLDFEWLSCQPLLPFLTQLIPAHLLYRSLLAHGFEDSLEIVEWIRGEQLQKILDFDLWEKSSEFDVEDISFDKAMSWIQIWLAIGSNFAAERFLELEEESICLILSKIFEIIPEGISEISEDIKENWWKTADNRFYLRIRENANENFDVLKLFVDALYTHNVRLAASLFAYSCMLVRQETLEEGLRWRSNRVSDQGFITYNEALSVLSPKKLIDLKKFIEESKKSEQERAQAAIKKSSYLFVENEIQENTVIAPEDFESVVKLLSSFSSEEGSHHVIAALGHEKVTKLIGFSNVSLEQVYDDDNFLNEISESIISSCKNILLNLEFRSTKSESPKLLIEKAIIAIGENDKQKLILLKESISYLSNCVNTITHTKFNYNTLLSSILTTRGAINIGLELCLKMPEEYGLKLPDSDPLFNAIYCIKNLGIHFLFHLGWNLLFKIERNLCDKLIEIDKSHPVYKGKLNTVQNLKLSDNSIIPVSLDKLISNLRFADVLKWLSTCEGYFSNELFFTMKALLSRVPQFPKTLNEYSNYVTTETRAFESLDDINLVSSFVDNLSYNFSMSID